MNRDLFDEELELPDRTAQQRLNRLVGLGSIKAALVTNAIVLLDPTALADMVSHHPRLGLADRREIRRANTAVRSRWRRRYREVHSG